MKALLDMPVSAALLDVLRIHGHEGVHAYHLGLDRASDAELLEFARREERVVITADLFSPLACPQFCRWAWCNPVPRRQLFRY